ncbi:MAG: hypothetical protein A2X12_01380 [Bacteroidetes bacterium GWE2_29_8]|nr:MAG: hypothetical protein A2X12_01380 [Bacteroidetes bacterium GWE2_29_8]OFY23401.1 MAG: hypothetical protein A2X02_08855 [Bacteroidetes bacterium GWF2_29_10]
MNYKLSDIIDIEKTYTLLNSFYTLTGFTTAILDIDGNLIYTKDKEILGAGWQKICLNFHRKHPETNKKCIESDTTLSTIMGVGKNYACYKCHQGMIDAAVPIIIKGKHFGNLFAGQFLFEAPNIDFFIQQANKYGFDEKEYIEALLEVPIFSEEKVKLAMNFLSSLAEYIGESGIKQLDLLEKNREYKILNDNYLSQNEEYISLNEEYLAQNDDLKKAIDKIELSEKKYSQLFRKMTNGFALHKIILDKKGKPLDYVFLEVNSAYEQLTGLKIENIIGKTVRQIIPEIEQFWIDTYGQVALTGENISFEQYSKPLNSFFSIVAYSPERFKFCVIVENITERKQLELEVAAQNEELSSTNEEVHAANEQLFVTNKELEHSIRKLEESECKYKGLLERLPNIVMLLNLKGNIVYVSSSIKPILGFEQSEIIGKKINVLISKKEDIKLFRNIIKNASNGFPLETINIYQSKKDGSEILVELIFIPIFENNKINGVQVIATDITEKLKIEKLEREKIMLDNIAKSKQQFLANMSHEIRTPMTGILGITEILKQTTKLDEQQNFYTDIILSSSESLLNILNDILDLSKIEANKMELQPLWFDFTKNINTIKNLFSALTTKKGIYFDVQIASNFPSKIFADKNRLNQIITNFVSNAVKFTEKGTVKLCVDILDNKNSGVLNKSNLVNIIVKVIDTGIGISESFQEKIFESFTQADISKTKTFEGTGLGLTISKKFIELMGGEIGLKSKLGNGSEFWFSFCVPFEYEEFNINTEEQIEQKIQFGFNVLYAEDKLTNQMVVELMLKNLGCSVDIANNGLQAVEMALKKKYDIIFLDIMMPIMDGVEAFKELQKKIKKEEMPYIICITAGTMEGSAEYYIQLGMDDYLSKPFKINDIIKKITPLIYRQKNQHID